MRSDEIPWKHRNHPHLLVGVSELVLAGERSDVPDEVVLSSEAAIGGKKKEWGHVSEC